MYDIKIKVIRGGLGFFSMFFFVGLFFFLLFMFVYKQEGTLDFGLILFAAVPLLAMSIAIYNVFKIEKRVKMVRQLNEVGKLVKGIPYTMVPTGAEFNGRQILKPQIEYHLPGGSVLLLSGDGRFDGRMADKDGLVDLVIDENNPDNYFIDFEINRIGGNQESDYYKIPKDQNKKDPYEVNYGNYNEF